MDEAMIQALIEMGAIPEEQAMLLRQANQGQQMMQTPGATGQNVAGTYVAANPVEHLSVALQRIMGGQQQKTAEQGYRDTLGKQTAGRKTYADALLQQILGGQQQPPQAAVTEMPTMYIGG